MRPAIFLVPFFALLAACSSDGGSGGGGNTPSQTPNSLEPTSDGSAPLPVTTIAIQGKGSVVSRDTRVDCTSDGTTTTGTCTTYYEAILYAAPVLGWSFSHWEPAVSDSSAFLVTMAAPAAVTAVFTQD